MKSAAEVDVVDVASAVALAVEVAEPLADLAEVVAGGHAVDRHQVGAGVEDLLQEGDLDGQLMPLAMMVLVVCHDGHYAQGGGRIGEDISQEIPENPAFFRGVANFTPDQSGSKRYSMTR